MAHCFVPQRQTTKLASPATHEAKRRSDFPKGTADEESARALYLAAHLLGLLLGDPKIFLRREPCGGRPQANLDHGSRTR